MDGFKTRLAKEQRDHCIKKRFDVFTAAYKEYVDNRSLDEPLPTAADLFQAEGVRDFILAEPVEDGIEQDVVQDFVNNRAAEYQPEWIKTVNAKIVEKMKPHAEALGLDKGAIDESTLNLAVALFKCKFCYNHTEIHASALPFHSCTRTRSPRVYGDDLPQGADTDEDLKTFVSHTSRMPWDIWDCFTLSDGVPKLITAMRKLDLDPTSVTLQALDQLDPIFEFPSPPSNGGRQMYSCRGLMVCDRSFLRSGAAC